MFWREMAKKSIVIREFNDNKEKEDTESPDHLCPEGTWHFKENNIVNIEFTDNNFREDVENYDCLHSESKIIDVLNSKYAVLPHG